MRHYLTRPSTTRLAAAAVLILVATLTAAAHGSLWVPRERGVADIAQLVTIVIVSFTASFAVAAALSTWSRRRGGSAPSGLLPGAVVLAVLFSLWGVSNLSLHMVAPAGVERTDSDSGRPGIRLRMDWGSSAVRDPAEEGSDEALPPASALRALFIRALLGLVVILAMWLVIRGRQPRRETESGWSLELLDPRLRAAAHGAIVTTIDAMLGDPDPRTAIIGAYARLLEELEAIGASRKPYEGPREHLARALGMLEIGPRPLRTLVGLFELARFSDHSLTAKDRDQALDALREAAADLAPPAGEPAVAAGA